MSSNTIYKSKNYYLNFVCNKALKNKYTRWYFNIINAALERNHKTRKDANEVYGYTEGHHILPRSLKKEVAKDKTNMVYLTSREHFIVHALLVKMFVDVYRFKMINAFLRMKSTNNKDLPNRYFNSKLYSLYRKYFSERNSWSMKNQKNHTNKKLHCYNPNTKERVRIASIDDLPEGFVMGCPLNTKGMISVYNTETLETKRVRTLEDIPSGWERGNGNNKGNQAVKGRINIYHPLLKIRKRIRPEDPIPEGFVRGFA